LGFRSAHQPDPSARIIMYIVIRVNNAAVESPPCQEYPGGGIVV